MKRSLLPLNALRAFDAAARHMSFKRAADDLSVTPAAISQQIRSLEETLGVELFKRTSRTLILTEAAQLALASLKEGFEKMEEAVDAMTATKDTNTLRISVAPSFATKWLVPRLASYYQRRPNAVVKVSASMAVADFQAQEVDLAVRYGLGNYPGMHSEELLRDMVYPVCSPDLLGGKKSLSSPEEITELTLIHDDNGGNLSDTYGWNSWLRAAGIKPKEGMPALHFNAHVLAIEAAIAGRGVALARHTIAEADIKAGRLVRPFGEAIPIDFAHYIVCPPEKLQLEQVQDFINWLKEEVSVAASNSANITG